MSTITAAGMRMIKRFTGVLKQAYPPWKDDEVSGAPALPRSARQEAQGDQRDQMRQAVLGHKNHWVLANEPAVHQHP